MPKSPKGVRPNFFLEKHLQVEIVFLVWWAGAESTVLPRVVCRCCKGSPRARGSTRLFGRGTHTTGLGKTNSLQQSCFLVHFGCWRSYWRGRPARQLRQQGPQLETIANLHTPPPSSPPVGTTHVCVFGTRTSTEQWYYTCRRLLDTYID